MYGRAVVGPSGVDLRFTGVLRFPSGVMAEFTSAFTMDHRGLEAIGDEGSAMLLDPWQADPATLVRDGEVTHWHPDDPNPWRSPTSTSSTTSARRFVAGPSPPRAGSRGGPGACPRRALRIGAKRQRDRPLGGHDGRSQGRLRFRDRVHQRWRAAGPGFPARRPGPGRHGRVDRRCRRARPAAAHGGRRSDPQSPAHRGAAQARDYRRPPRRRWRSGGSWT